jgi:hypothetical protein
MTARYADMASELRKAMYAFGDRVDDDDDDIPAYGYARPWRRVKVRLAMREHHEACKDRQPTSAMVSARVCQNSRLEKRKRGWGE